MIHYLQSFASKEVPIVTQLDEERKRLWELAKANLEKAHKRYKDFVDKSRHYKHQWMITFIKFNTFYRHQAHIYSWMMVMGH